MLKRHAYDQLLNWKNRKTKQGLLVTGARQVGKTTLIEQFGADHYEHVAKVNFIEMPQAVETVSKAKDTEDLILRLSVLSGTEITPGKTLLFLDEIQACEDMLTWTKFLSGAKGLDVIVSGSLLGSISMSSALHAGCLSPLSIRCVNVMWIDGRFPIIYMNGSPTCGTSIC